MFGREKRLGSFTPSSLIIAIRLRNRLFGAATVTDGG